MIHTKDQIASAIKNIPTMTTEDLAFNFKCASSKKNPIYHPFMAAVERELRKRSKTEDENETQEV